MSTVIEPAFSGREKWFEPSATGQLVNRPNRFIARVEVPRRGVVECHCPDPGRLQDLLIPGAEVILESASRTVGSRRRRTTDTLAAVRPAGRVDPDGVVPLIPHRANRVVESLVLPGLFPDVPAGHDVPTVHGEVPFAGGRADFLVVDGQGETLVEVKCVSLCARGVALFPDAASARAVRHIEHLDAAAGNGRRAAVVFLVTRPEARVLVPNLHVDTAFTRALAAATTLAFHAVKVRCQADGTVDLVGSIPVELITRPRGAHGYRYRQDRGGVDIDESGRDHVDRSRPGPDRADPNRPTDDGLDQNRLDLNRGIYVLALELPDPIVVELGGIRHRLDPGHYLYVGSAQRALDARIARHRRRRKRLHWHIDHILAAGRLQEAFPIRLAGKRWECRTVDLLVRRGGSVIAGIGAGDCRCAGHLLRWNGDPRIDRAFITLLFALRHHRAQQAVRGQ